MIKAVLFYIHKVITHGEFYDVYKGFSERTGVPEQVVATYHRENLDDLLRGLISASQMLSDLDLEQSMSVEDMLNLWTEETLKVMIVDEKMTSLLKELKGKYILATLTNLTEHRRQADIKMGLYDLFDYKILSFEVGAKKPEVTFFEKALDLLRVNPNEAVFIDDQEQNVRVAKEMGMQAILFTEYKKLVNDLGVFGVSWQVTRFEPF